MRRPVWLAAGVAVGVGGTLWAEQRVRKGVRQAAARLSPDQVTAGARTSVRRLGDRVRVAVDTGREERARREEELWAELGGRREGAPGRPAHRRRSPDGARGGSGL
jgi:hypothetical protein